MMRQRFYLNGKLQKTSSPNSPEILRAQLDRIQADWSRNIGPLVADGAFDPNNGHKVTRISADELLVITTGNRSLRFVNVEVK